MISAVISIFNVKWLSKIKKDFPLEVFFIFRMERDWGIFFQKKLSQPFYFL